MIEVKAYEGTFCCHFLAPGIRSSFGSCASGDCLEQLSEGTYAYLQSQPKWGQLVEFDSRPLGGELGPMPSTEAAATDPTAGVVPPPRPSAPWRVQSVEALPGLRLQVRFADGTSGQVDMKRFLGSPDIHGTVFEPLVDESLFGQVRVDLGAVVWPTGADLSPDAMYDAIRASGEWVLE